MVSEATGAKEAFSHLNAYYLPVITCSNVFIMYGMQEWAAEHCSAPYRAPELWDCPSNSDIDERTDIWSLGCTLYAIMYAVTPSKLFVDLFRPLYWKVTIMLASLIYQMLLHVK